MNKQLNFKEMFDLSDYGLLSKSKKHFDETNGNCMTLKYMHTRAIPLFNQKWKTTKLFNE